MAGAPEQLKRRARTLAREALGAVPPADAARWSQELCRRLTASAPWRAARTIMAYAPLPGEPDVTDACRDAIRAGRTLTLPRIDWDGGTMIPARVNSMDAGLVARRHAVREPGPEAPAIDPATLDLVLVPGLAFDAQGQRLGRGGGYYDRFLLALAARPAPLSVATIGVAFEVQLIDRVPTRPEDVPVRMVVTERRMIEAPAR